MDDLQIINNIIIEAIDGNDNWRDVTEEIVTQMIRLTPPSRAAGIASSELEAFFECTTESHVMKGRKSAYLKRVSRMRPPRRKKHNGRHSKRANL